MKIRPNAGFSAIPVEPAIPPAELDAPAMQAESIRLTLVQAGQIFRFENNLPAKYFPESRKEVQSQIRKNSN